MKITPSAFLLLSFELNNKELIDTLKVALMVQPIVASWIQGVIEPYFLDFPHSCGVSRTIFIEMT